MSVWESSRINCSDVAMYFEIVGVNSPVWGHLQLNKFPLANFVSKFSLLFPMSCGRSKQRSHLKETIEYYLTLGGCPFMPVVALLYWSLVLIHIQKMDRLIRL